MAEIDFSSYERMLEQAQERAKRFGALPGALQEVTGWAQSDDGLVRVEVGVDGELRDLLIESQAMRLSSVRLSEYITAAFAAAREDAQNQVRAIVDDVAGEGALDEMPKGVEQVREQMDSLMAGVDSMTNDVLTAIARLRSQR
jgi:DNA-binding protein YbaB